MYFASAWVSSFGGLFIDPLTCSTTSFSMRIKLVLFFHARKLTNPTNLLLSLQKDILINSDVDIKLITLEDTPWWQYLQFVSFFIFDDVVIEDFFLKKMFSFKILLDPNRGRSPWIFNDDNSSFILASP